MSEFIMRKRNHTVTIRMNDKEYTLLRQKMKESGQTQQAVVLAAIENVEIVSSEVMEELKILNQRLEETNRQLRGATTNLNQIAHHMNAGGFYPRADVFNSLNENISGYRKECEKIWRSIRQLISGQIPMGQ